MDMIKQTFIDFYNIIRDLGMSIYKLVSGFFYKFLPEEVAGIIMILLLAGIVGIILTKFIVYFNNK